MLFCRKSLTLRYFPRGRSLLGLFRMCCRERATSFEFPLKGRGGSEVESTVGSDLLVKRLAVCSKAWGHPWTSHIILGQVSCRPNNLALHLSCFCSCLLGKEYLQPPQQLKSLFWLLRFWDYRGTGNLHSTCSETQSHSLNHPPRYQPRG